MATWSLEVNGNTFDLDVTNGIVVTRVVGAGMPPVVNALSEYVIVDGGHMHSTRARPRVLTLALDLSADSWSDFRAIRRALVQAVSPGTCVRIWYTDGSDKYYLDAYYEGGLEGNGTRGFVEEGILLRFIAPDPYWRSTEISQEIDQAQNITAGMILKEKNGVWDNLAGGLSTGSIECILEGPDGNIYVGGRFTATSGSLVVNNVAMWDGSQWHALGSGVTGGVAPCVYGMSFAPNGDLYVVGKFSSASGVANTIGIARWDGANWHSVGGGLESTSHEIYDIVISQDQKVYVTGYFTQIGGVSANHIAIWDGSTWSALGSGLNNWGNALACDGGRIYCTGAFTSAGGTAANYIAMWDGASWSALGDGLGAQGLTLYLDRTDQRLYVGGSFVTAGGESARKITYWDGYRWRPLGSVSSNGLNGDVYGITRLSSGYILLTGDFTEAAGILCGRVALWNGYAFVSPGLYIPTGLWDYGRAVLETADGSLYYAGGFETDVPVSAKTTVSNPGTASSHAVIEIEALEGDPLFYMIRNERNGATLWGNYQLHAGETLTLNTAVQAVPASSSIATADLRATPLPGSSLARFRLEPGDNDISVFVTPGVANVAIRFSPAFLGVE